MLNFRAIKRDSLDLLRHNFGRATVTLAISVVCSAACLLIFQAGVAFSVQGADASEPREIVATMLSADTSDSREIVMTMLSADTSDSREIFLPLLAASGFALLVVTPIRLGITRWHYILAVRGSAKISHMFYFCFRRYFPAVWFEMMRILRLGMAGFLCFLPAALSLGQGIRFSLDADRVNPIGGQALTLLGLVLGLLGGIMFLIITLRLFLARYLFASGQETKPLKCFNISGKMMRGEISNRIETELSLIGWYALCLLLLPISFVMPLRSICLANCAREILAAKRHSSSSSGISSPKSKF